MKKINKINNKTLTKSKSSYFKSNIFETGGTKTSTQKSAESKAKRWTRDWYSNPTTKQMMGELDTRNYSENPVEINGNTITNEDQARQILVANSLYNTPIEYTDEFADNKLGQTYESVYDPSKYLIKINSNLTGSGLESTITHEGDHVIQYNLPFLNETTQPVPHTLKPGVEYNDYLDSPNEIRSRIMETRKALNLDPSKRNYTPEEAAKMQEDLVNMGDMAGGAVYLNRLEPETMAGYLNYLAQNNTVNMNEDGIYSASQGGRLMKHSYGGNLNHSGDFSNDVIFIDEGGTHEQNPFEGVLMGFDNEGTPNLVEEGEVIYNDYVFSNRLKPTKKLLENGGFTDKYEDWTFAAIAEDMQKESSERPNDLISKQTLNDLFGRLTQMQEEVRMKKKQKENSFDKGGLINNKFDGKSLPSNVPNLLNNGPKVDIKYPNNKLAGENNYRVRMLTGFDPVTTDEVDSEKFDWKNFGLDVARVGAPLAAQFSALMNNLEEPDYSQNERSLNEARNAPISNIQVNTTDISPKKVDQNYMSNMIRNQGNTLLSHYANMSDNAPQAMAYMMLANKQNQEQQSDAYIKGEDTNWTRGLQAAEFNRGNEQLESSTDFQNFANNAARYKDIITETARAGIANSALNAARAEGIIGSSGDMANTIANFAKEKQQAGIINEIPSLLYDILGNYKASAKYGRLLTKSKKRRK